MNNEMMLCETGKRMCQQRLVVACDGNISCIDYNGNIIITPSGVSKGALTPDMLLYLDRNGQVVQGAGKPSSEMNLHMRIYQQRPDVRAIVHAHPPVSTAVTVAGIEFPNNVVTEGRDFLGKVKTVPYEAPASDELARACASALSDCNVILMANHGAVAVGATLQEACYRMETLEAVASIYRDSLIFATAGTRTGLLSLLKEKG